MSATSFTLADLPNPHDMTDPANIAFLQQKKDDEGAAPKKTTSKKRKSEEGASGSTAKKAKKAAAGGDAEPKDLFSITLPGDENAEVEILDSCDELRRKINALLRTGTITKAAFLRDISRAAYTDAPNIQSKQLTDFLSKKGATAGSTSRVCYASYVYFEKKRVAEGKAKSKHRKDMEDRWEGKGGLPQQRERGYWVGPGDKVVQDSLGSVRTIPGGRF
ncbi:hypothetical protein FB45DRAFT_933441 [Roridomyces roridus]|uniref:DUF7726 domain-containing protein n=1 Tax=Roridomyces roridus TaxID=1738132 RepID=A0AAD7BCT3_9AGAR|nr:hypothetical protein FB45DRAFT_933441 [Roridomyces roridus]